MACPCLALAQSIHLSSSTYLPLPHGKKDNGKAAVANAAIRSADTTSSFINTVDETTGVPLTFTSKYNATVINTNFTLPLLRVNFLVNKPVNSSNSLTSTSFFNSAGAGINISTGDLDVTKDSGGNTVSVDYHNHFGFQAGFLFASSSATGTTTDQSGKSTTQSGTIFALVAGISILNFQVGGGYELGSLAPGQRRGFLTIAYAIPMSVLIDGGYKILKISNKTAQ